MQKHPVFIGETIFYSVDHASTYMLMPSTRARTTALSDPAAQRIKPIDSSLLPLKTPARRFFPWQSYRNVSLFVIVTLSVIVSLFVMRRPTIDAWRRVSLAWSRIGPVVAHRPAAGIRHHLSRSTRARTTASGASTRPTTPNSDNRRLAPRLAGLEQDRACCVLSSN